MKVDKYTVTDSDLKREYDKWNFGDKSNDKDWRRKHTACQLLKRMEGYYISHSQKAVLANLKMLNSEGKPNKKGRRFLFDVYFEQKYS